MSPQQQALLEQSAVIAAHVRVFANLVDNWAAPEDLLAQLQRVKIATEAYAKLPRPEAQQKAA